MEPPGHQGKDGEIKSNTVLVPGDLLLVVVCGILCGYFVIRVIYRKLTNNSKLVGHGIDDNLQKNGLVEEELGYGEDGPNPVGTRVEFSAYVPKSNRSRARNYLGAIWTWRLPFVDFPLSHVLVMVLYIGLNFACAQEEADLARAYGTLVGANCFLATIPATRNSALIYMTGIPYDKTILFHRWVGVFTVLFTTLHSGVSWNTPNTPLRWWCGCAGWICALLILFTSFYLLRRHLFELFFYSHFLFLGFIVMGCVHDPQFIKYAVGSMVVYVIDRVFRFVWGFNTMLTTSLEVKGSQVVHVVFPKHKSRKYKVGQYVFLNFPTVSRMEWHPFSLSSGPDELTSEVYIKALGSYTQALVDKAGTSTNLPIRVDGPYGTLDVNLHRFPVLLLITGGIGFAPSLGILKDIYLPAHKARSVRSCISAVFVVWTVQTIAQYKWFGNEMEDIQLAAKGNPHLPTLHSFIHITKEEHVDEGLVAGRPRFADTFDLIVQHHPKQATYVFVCGPMSMVKSVWDEANKKSLQAHNRFQFHHETFEF